MSRNHGQLTPDERLRVAYGHFILGINKQDLAAVFGVSSGRVTEACVAIKAAMDDPMPLYEQSRIGEVISIEKELQERAAGYSDG